jgi:hypothetical protein
VAHQSLQSPHLTHTRHAHEPLPCGTTHFYRHASRVAIGRATCVRAEPRVRRDSAATDHTTPKWHTRMLPSLPQPPRFPRAARRHTARYGRARYAPALPPLALHQLVAPARCATAHDSLSTAVRGPGRPGGPRSRGCHAGARGSRGSCAPSGCTGSTWLLCRQP